MGKDQELLEAARNGNTPVVEKILGQRANRRGPLASLRRGPGANVQDSSGYSALHHAALNGHENIVQLLLAHEASTNIVDGKGSSPLHLAAWTGNVDIVRLLLCHGPSVPNVNLLTKDRETALHCAAQYGHTAVVSQLLEHSCDPSIRNSRQETALDLAAQYGRLETVEMLVRTHPELLQAYMTHGSTATSCNLPHTPLHLASRNGHKAVVEVLLNAGLDVNVRTAGGTALHEAALCGKLEVARTLLEHGVDLGIRDEHHNTVNDLLKQFPPHVVHDITVIIARHRAINGDELSLSGDQTLPPIPVPSLGSPYENVRVPSSHSPTQWDRRVSASSAISIGSDSLRHHGGSNLSKSLMESSFLSDDMSLYPRSRDVDQMSVSSTASSTGGPSPRDIYLPMTPAGHHTPSPTANNKVSPTPPKKPPRRNLSVSPTHLTPLMSLSADCAPGGGAYEYLFLARSGVRSHGDLDNLMLSAKQLRRGKSADQYVDMKLRHSLTGEENTDPYDGKYQPVAITSLYENIPIRTTNPRRKLRRIHDKNYENCDPSMILSRGDLPFRKVEASSPAVHDTLFVSNAHITLKSSQESLLNGEVKKMSNCPLSPTHYQQPPTPDHPPPSALQAERSIHERIRPLSQMNKESARRTSALPANISLIYPHEQVKSSIRSSLMKTLSGARSLSAYISKKLHRKFGAVKENSLMSVASELPDKGFGSSVAFQLEYMDLQQRTIAEKLITDVLFHGQLGNLKSSTSVSLENSCHYFHRQPSPALFRLPRSNNTRLNFQQNSYYTPKNFIGTKKPNLRTESFTSPALETTRWDISSDSDLSTDNSDQEDTMKEIGRILIVCNSGYISD